MARALEGEAGIKPLKAIRWGQEPNPGKMTDIFAVYKLPARRFSSKQRHHGIIPCGAAAASASPAAAKAPAVTPAAAAQTPAVIAAQAPAVVTAAVQQQQQ